MTYDSWKLATPPEHETDDTRCPHGEDTPDDCPTCRPDEEEAGPCTHLYNGDRCDLCGLPIECVDIDVSALMPRRKR